MVDITNKSDSEKKVQEQQEQEANKLAGLINLKFQASERARQSDEDRWLESFHNYRGKYYKNVRFREHEKSRVFVKVTKTKVLAAYGQIAEVLFGGNRFPISIDPTTLPDGVEDTVSFETNP